MSFETAIAIYALITLILLGNEIMFTYATQGFAFGFSSNRPAIEKSPLGLRIERSYRNQAESAAYILPALVLGALSDLQTPGLQTAALVIVLGRALFALLYYTGLPLARVLGFVMGSFGSLYVIIAILLTI
jgi:uncharacterized MAPEG superfamily protein